VGAGADLLRSVAAPADDHYLFSALTRIVDPMTNPRTEHVGGNYPAPVDQLLGAFRGLEERGYVFDQAALGEPGALLAYLDSFRAKPAPRPKEWKQHFEEGTQSPVVLIREAAIYSLPYPIPSDCAVSVNAERSDSDEGIKSAVLFASERKSIIYSSFPNVPPQVIQLPTGTDGGK